jgi:hypothetical protein
VRVGWLTRWIHYPNGDTFTNAEVPGAQWWTISDIQNLPDATGAPVKGLTVTLESDESFDYLDDEASEERPGPLTRRGPPVYEWSFPDLPEQLDPGVVYDTTVGFGQREQYMARPGFDVTRTFDQTVFTEPGTQTVTITVTPRELWVESVSIGVIAHQDEHYTSSVVSISGAPQAFVEPSGWAAGASDIPVQVDVPVTITAVVQVVPKSPPVEYKSMVNTGAEGPFEPGERATGTVVGSALVHVWPWHVDCAWRRRVRVAVAGIGTGQKSRSAYAACTASRGRRKCITRS